MAGPSRQVHTHLLAAIAAAIAPFFIVVVLAVTVAGRGRDQFGGGSVGQLEDAVRAQGLTICAAADGEPRSDEQGVLSTRVFAVGSSDSCGSTLTVQVDAYSDASHRDSAARAAEARQRPRTFHPVYTWRQFTVYMPADEASGSETIRDGVVDALESVGAR